ncbi:hypothetical protein [Bordetella trematum]|uniref:hypothetical protein n=1 Tax=Bordetella trematum TaxID=123899 RepID=UPI000F636218|nr:hypothetical protein [Bordetella trematum]
MPTHVQDGCYLKWILEVAAKRRPARGEATDFCQPVDNFGENSRGNFPAGFSIRSEKFPQRHKIDIFDLISWT